MSELKTADGVPFKWGNEYFQISGTEIIARIFHQDWKGSHYVK